MIISRPTPEPLKTGGAIVSLFKGAAAAEVGFGLSFPFAFEAVLVLRIVVFGYTRGVARFVPLGVAAAFVRLLPASPSS